MHIAVKVENGLEKLKLLLQRGTANRNVTRAVSRMHHHVYEYNYHLSHIFGGASKTSEFFCQKPTHIVMVGLVLPFNLYTVTCNLDDFLFLG